MAKKINLSTTPIAFFDDDRVPAPGFYTLTGEVEKDENGIVHETNMVPGKRVFPSSDGESFVDEEGA